jgi:hypothetical protein
LQFGYSAWRDMLAGLEFCVFGWLCWLAMLTMLYILADKSPYAALLCFLYEFDIKVCYGGWPSMLTILGDLLCWQDLLDRLAGLLF